MKISELLEDESLPLFFSMALRLQDKVDQGLVYYQTSGSPARVKSLRLDDRGSMELWMESKPTAVPPWVAYIAPRLAKLFTIVRDTIDGQKVWVLKEKQVSESLDIEGEKPLLVTMLGRLLANHFKKGGPAVVLVDGEFGDDPMPIRGYEWRDHNDTLLVNVKGGSYGYRDVLYTGDLVKNGKMKLKQVDGEWELRVMI